MHIRRLVRSVLRQCKQEMMPYHADISDPIPYRFSERDVRIVAEIVRSGTIHHEQGLQMTSFEREFAAFTGVRHAIAVNSGTSALMLAVSALGLSPGDEVIVPAYTFVATAQAVLANNAVPVFADIDSTFTVSPKSISRKITKKTRAIIVVHMFGNVCDMEKIIRIARRHHLLVIEDCAQAIGAKYQGNSVGSMGDIGCFSFNMKKALPTGQGGMAITNSDTYDERMIAARNTGLSFTDGMTDVVSFGGTYFMTEIEAALGRSVLRQIRYLNGVRKANFLYLMHLLEPISELIRIYSVTPYAEPSYSRLSFMLNMRNLRGTRDEFIQKMVSAGIAFKKFYPTPLYRYSLFSRHRNILTGVPFPFGSMPKYHPLPYAERFGKEHIGMEFSPYWNASDMRKIATEIMSVIGTLRK